MDNRYGVIDLGTNTFHLLIVEKLPNGNTDEVFRKRVFVKLASAGIQAIGPAPFQRGLNAMVHFHQVLEKYQVKNIRAIGTAALRTASNGNEFVQLIAQKTGIGIQLIDGTEEARLIFQGVKEAYPLKEDKILIMDIGGGSVEFIIANQSGIKWSQSFPIGVAVLFKSFHKNDPISSTEIQEINRELTQILCPLFDALKQHAVDKLIGASGTFDVLELFLSKENNASLYATIPVASYTDFSKKIIFTTVADRLKLQRLPDSRADLIVVALVLIDFIVKAANIHTIITSPYAMKEGVLAEMIKV